MSFYEATRGTIRRNGAGMKSGIQGRIAKFGVFEADLGHRRLSKSGFRIRLQEQPFQILALLLERPGQVLTREQLKEALWAGDTFVAFDDGLNTAIKKLRAALCDTPDNPRFIETVPRVGYRFIAPVSIDEAPSSRPLQRLLRLRVRTPRSNPMLLRRIRAWTIRLVPREGWPLPRSAPRSFGGGRWPR
jgi:DNA-binding winged helix-turn-helix (wHTH) protein